MKLVIVDPSGPMFPQQRAKRSAENAVAPSRLQLENRATGRRA